jgi:hypothetical protein
MQCRCTKYQHGVGPGEGREGVRFAVQYKVFENLLLLPLSCFLCSVARLLWGWVGLVDERDGEREEDGRAWVVWLSQEGGKERGSASNE